MNTQSTQSPESLGSPSGSRSSDTSETSRFIREFDPIPCWEWEGYARRLESERDKALKALSDIEEIYIDGCDTYEDWQAMGTIARDFSFENTES